MLREYYILRDINIRCELYKYIQKILRLIKDVDITLIKN